MRVYNSPGGEEGEMHDREREQGDEQIVKGLLCHAACECKESHPWKVLHSLE